MMRICDFLVKRVCRGKTSFRFTEREGEEGAVKRKMKVKPISGSSFYQKIVKNQCVTMSVKRVKPKFLNRDIINVKIG